jgi:ribonuclease-3
MLYMKGVKIEYRDVPSKAKKHRDHKIEMFTVGCFLHGYTPQPIQIGWGTAASKKDAGALAAKMALDGTKVLKPFVEQKQRFDVARKEQAAAARAAAKAEASTTS